MQKFVLWWERGLIAALALSVALLGIGRVEFIVPDGGSISAWSVSRTTFFFWLVLKLLLLVRNGWAVTGLSRLRSLSPLFLFFTLVTLSLLPDFHQAGDYRYFFFGCAHAVMLVDLFSSGPQRRWLPLLLGLVPLVLVARGFVRDPLILNFDLSHRFAFPLDSWNTAGYVLAMSIPLCLLVTIVNAGWWRALGLLSCAGQMLALILSFSRGAWLGWGASMVYLAATTKKWKYIAVLVALTTTCVLVAPSLQSRLVTISQPLSDQSISERVQLLRSSVQLGLENTEQGEGNGSGRLKESLRSRLEGTVLEDSPFLLIYYVFIDPFTGDGFTLSLPVV